MLVTVIDVDGYACPSLRLVVHCVGLLIALPIVLSLSLSYEIGLKPTITNCVTNRAITLSFEIGLNLPISCQLWHFLPSQGYPYWSKIHIPPALSNRRQSIVCKLAHRKLCDILRNWIVGFIGILMLVTVIDVIRYTDPSLRLVVHCVGLPIALQICYLLEDI